MAAALLVLVAAGLIGHASAGACTPVDSCPKLSDGLYCPVNDVTQHANINRDLKTIADHLDETPVNYAAALNVYTNGLHSTKSSGLRTLQSMALKDMTGGTAAYTNTFFTGALTLYGSKEAIWDNIITGCFAEPPTTPCVDKTDAFRRNVLNKGMIGIVMAYTTYEMGAALGKLANGQTTDAGGVYNWDEAAAFFIGNIAPLGDGVTTSPGGLKSPYEFVWKRDNDFNGANLHAASLPILNYGLINARGSDYNEANMQVAQADMYKIMAITAIRSALKYSFKAYNGGTYSDEYHAEGFTYWRSASGFISNYDKPAVEAVDELLKLSLTNIPANTWCLIKDHLEPIYSALGITCQMVGAYTGSGVAGTCLENPCSLGLTGSLSAGSSAYVDMCKDTSTSLASQIFPSTPTAAVVAAAMAATCDFA